MTHTTWYKDLIEENKKLTMLLEDPQPGTMIWQTFLQERLKNIHNIIHRSGAIANANSETHP